MGHKKYSFQYLSIINLYGFLGTLIGEIILLPIVACVLEAYNLEQAA